ncbi:mimivirus translation initiation factor 4e, 1 [Tupanvirus deep ocean]|uniref:Mimivirus translation initiation factor 4e, 1 n=2 Tax=Tupanvirus TaxID=2094720 RepID=A0AC62A7H8_9VIRU|nr:mimivirus translation initiation factor 4e, 1 [Tupanvirus deep ocean]QKU33734.1 mimivirus translation initiation factor 4e, 1 [Tupanvirus deep ocean]
MLKPIYDIDSNVHPNTPGLEYPLTNAWTLWKQHETKEKYKYNFMPCCRFNTIAGYWSLLNNISINKGQRIIFMREGIAPKWEDVHNISGAHFIITIDSTKQNSDEIFRECLLALIGESICNETYDSLKISGLTYIYEDKLKQIRFWLTDSIPKFSLSNISDDFYEILQNKKLELNQFLFITFEKLKEKHKQNRLLHSRKPRNDRQSNYRKIH